MSGLSAADVEALVRLFESSDWERLDLVSGDAELHLSKTVPVAQPVPAPMPLGTAVAAPVATRPTQSEESARAATAKVAKAAEKADAGDGLAPDSEGLLEIRAPHLGTFYRAPKPGAPAYVEVGARVTAETEVCLMEVMKLFTTLRAGVSGVVQKVCIPDSTLVESGQTLFLIRPER